MSTKVFSISAKESKKLFKPLFSIINATTVLPILEDVMISQNGVLKLTATDLENVVIVEYPSESKEICDFCVPANKLKNFINNSLDDTIDFYLHGKEEYISIKSGGCKLKTVTDRVSDFPRLPVLENPTEIKMNGSIIIPSLVNALKFVSNDDLRPAMTGVCLIDYKDELCVVSTDAYRLYWNGVIKTPAFFKGKSMILNQKFVRIAVETFTEKQDIDISFDANYIVFKSGTTTLFGRLIDARYPDFSVVIPQPFNLTFYLIRKQTVAFLKLAQFFSNKSTFQLNLIVSKDSISAQTKDVDYSEEMEYNIPVFNASCEFDKFEFGVNIKFLQQLLTVNKKEEYIKINHSTSPTKAIIIDDCTLIMPLMLNQ